MKRRLTPAEGAQLRAEIAAEFSEMKRRALALIDREVDKFIKDPSQYKPR